MDHAITFIIPVRHQNNASNWTQLKSRLSQTVQSIACQDCCAWHAVIVANEGADLPKLPAGFEVKRTNFPPNPLYVQGENNLETFRDAVRIDKGRRVLAGLLHAGLSRYVMVVDDDDFVSRRIASFSLSNPDENGWFIQNGYVWTEGSPFLYKYDEFMNLCGTSLIIRTGLFNLPATVDVADPEYVRRMLGSHIFPREELARRGTPLAPLPFPGAIYRTGHPGAHSRSKGTFQEYFFRKSVLMHPRRTFREIIRFRLKNASLNEEFFGVSGSSRVPNA